LHRRRYQVTVHVVGIYRNSSGRVFLTYDLPFAVVSPLRTVFQDYLFRIDIAIPVVIICDGLLFHFPHTTKHVPCRLIVLIRFHPIIRRNVDIAPYDIAGHVDVPGNILQRIYGFPRTCRSFFKDVKFKVIIFKLGPEDIIHIIFQDDIDGDICIDHSVDVFIIIQQSERRRIIVIGEVQRIFRSPVGVTHLVMEIFVALAGIEPQFGVVQRITFHGTIAGARFYRLISAIRPA